MYMLYMAALECYVLCFTLQVLTGYLLQCADALTNSLQNAEDPMYLLASLVGIMRAAWYYRLWNGHAERLMGLLRNCCQKISALMAGVTLDKFQSTLFGKIGGDQKYRE